MKKCNKCGEIKDEANFAKPTMCKSCYNAYARNYYKTINKEKHIILVKNRQKQIKHKESGEVERVKEYETTKKDFIQSFKKPCIICGESEKYAIDFHHLDKTKKSFTIGNSSQKRSKAELIEELNKCVCLCGNCHRLVNAGWIKLNETM